MPVLLTMLKVLIHYTLGLSKNNRSYTDHAITAVNCVAVQSSLDVNLA